MGDRRDSEPEDDDGPADAGGSDGSDDAPDLRTPDAPSSFEDGVDDPEAYVDDDAEPPEWVEEARRGADGSDDERESDREAGDDAGGDGSDGADGDANAVGDGDDADGVGDPNADEESAADETARDDTATDDADEVGTVDSEVADDAVAGDDETTDVDVDGEAENDGADDETADEESDSSGDESAEADGDEPEPEPEPGDESTEADEENTEEDDESYEIGPTDAESAGKGASAGAPIGSQPAGAGGGEGGGGGGGGFGEATAPDDEEMPLTEHVEEMALRFMAVGLVVVGVGAITLFYADELINFLWYSFLGPGADTCLQGSFLAGELSVTDACPSSVSPRVYHPLALVLARLKVASLVGLIAALPVAVYQTYRFMRPGLYPRERRYYLAAVPTSLVLAAVGVGFAYFAILPAMFSYFSNYSEQAADIAFGLTETFNLIVLMIGFFALTFQIPLLVMLAIMMGVTTRRWLEDRRLYFWGGFGAVAFLFSPDPTGMAPLMVAATMIGLFEGTLFLLRWTDSDSPLFSPVAFAERRPYAWTLAVAAGYLASAAPVPGSYYDRFPGVVRETLAFNELVAVTPVITAVVLVLLFELLAYLVRNYSRDVRVWDVVNRARFPYWMLALVVGYFASPNPPGLRTIERVALPTTEAVVVGAGLIVGYELLILTLRWRKKRTTAE